VAVKMYMNKKSIKTEITDNEIKSSNSLIKCFLKQTQYLDYAKVGHANEYLGWVQDFNLKDKDDKQIGLDLSKPNDLFLLFVLAVAWSRSGQWENAVFFVTYLKLNNKDTTEFWKDNICHEKEKAIRQESSSQISNALEGIHSRKKIAFRKDIYRSVHILAQNWNEILISLKKSEKEENFELFIDQMRSIKGLGVNNNRMLIKIPLILRELRCQKIIPNISGELCCVPDVRVYKAAKNLNISIPKASNQKNLIKSSKKIYELFGDLYDIPLFAYEDLNFKTKS